MSKVWLTAAAGVLLGAVVLGASGTLFAAPAFAADHSIPTNGSMALTPDDRILGKPDAPVTIIEYGSLGCPHCAAFDRIVFPELKKNWIDSGKARFVFRDFPLDNIALRAAQLARCTPPESYYDFIHLFFQSQAQWAHSDDVTPALERIAGRGGMGEKKFKVCMADDELQRRIVASRYDAEKAFNVRSTPTFIINGRMIAGVPPYEDLDDTLKLLSR